METIKQMISKNIFHSYKPNEALDRNAVDFHAMTGEHAEILGQFLDFTAMDVPQLKECLVSGYLTMDRTEFLSRG